MEKILRLPAVLAATGLRRSTIYRKISDGVFPKPIALSTRCIGFLESEVAAWIENRVSQSRQPKADHSNTVATRQGGRPGGAK